MKYRENKVTSKKTKKKLIKNQALLKRGGYAVAITAIFLAVLVIFNWLVGLLSERFHLEFDISPSKVNSMSEENIEYIEGIEKEIDIIVCADEASYPSYMSYYAQYQGASRETDYFNQTVNLINKYGEYNKNLNIRFIDPQSTEFTEISNKYSSQDITYGDILVVNKNGESERVKKVGFSDIYVLSSDDTYSQYYGTSTISGNDIETALTSAISYVLREKSLKAVIYNGHSDAENSDSMASLLTDNNYDVEILSDKILTSIPEDADLFVIAAPKSDFMGTELDVISSFLDNGGEYGKGMIYFADAIFTNLPNLNSLLGQWGINAGEGILFETSGNYSSSDDPTTLITVPDADASLPSDISMFITGYNVPLGVEENTDAEVKVLASTTETVVSAPVGATNQWNDYTDDDIKSYPTVIEAKKSDKLSADGLSSYIYAFSSVEYITSDWAERSETSNKAISLYCADIASGLGESDISFISKTVETESFTSTASSTTLIRIIFMAIIPIAMIVIGIYIFIRRKNA